MKSDFYKPKNHIDNLVSLPYYKDLIVLRNLVSLACDDYFTKRNSPKVDLYMVAKGVSSPMGKGSDSLPIPFRLGSQDVFLVDSAQFGMEPLVQKSFSMVYCYLPSFRGEDPDNRHLNQFYHCESELRGTYLNAMSIAEGLIKHILSKVSKKHKSNLFEFSSHNINLIEGIITKKFPVISFDEAEALLKKAKIKNSMEYRKYGRVITSKGELKLCELVTNNNLPIWITNYDRDVVPFYQKPDPMNENRVLNADLIFPSNNDSFGGEIIGLGQRQDNCDQMIESMDRQGISHRDSYSWYLNLRNRKDYVQTSGFGLGIERLIAWILRKQNISDTAIYPILKDEKVYY